MPVVHIDTRQFSGVEPGLEADNGRFWFWPYRPYVTGSALVSEQVVKIGTVDGVADPVLPETPLTEAVWVQPRGITGAGTPWLVQIPEGDCNLFDLPHIDESTLDPEAVPTPYWLNYMNTAIADAIDGILDGAPAALDTLAELADALGDDPNFATTIITSLGEKVDQTTYATAIDVLTAAASTAQSTADGAQTDASNALAAASDAQSTADDATDAAEAAHADATAALVAPLVTKRTLGDINLVNTAGAYEDLDNSGTPNARNLDIVFPDVVAGQVVELEPNLLASNGAGFVFLTFASIVNGAVVNQIHGAVAGGVAGWFLPASAFGTASGPFPYTLQAGDIEGGNARFRLRYRSNGSKTIYANGGTTYALAVIGRGPKG